MSILFLCRPSSAIRNSARQNGSIMFSSRSFFILLQINFWSSGLSRFDLVAIGFTPASRFLNRRICGIFAAATPQTGREIITSFPFSFNSKTTLRCVFIKSCPRINPILLNGRASEAKTFVITSSF